MGCNKVPRPRRTNIQMQKAIEICVTEKELVDLIGEYQKRNPFAILVLGSMIERGELRVHFPKPDSKEHPKDLKKISELRWAIVRSNTREHC